MQTAENDQELLFNYLVSTPKYVILSNRNKALKIPLSKIIFKEFKLQTQSIEGIKGLRTKFLICLAYPITEMTFAISCSLPRQGERRVAFMRFLPDNRKWIEERYDFRDYASMEELSIIDLENWNEIIRTIEQRWFINNVCNIKISYDTYQGRLLDD